MAKRFESSLFVNLTEKQREAIKALAEEKFEGNEGAAVRSLINAFIDSKND